MKKILSLALASALALGMSVTAFATVAITGATASFTGYNNLKVGDTFKMQLTHTTGLATVPADTVAVTISGTKDGSAISQSVSGATDDINVPATVAFKDFKNAEATIKVNKAGTYTISGTFADAVPTTIAAGGITFTVAPATSTSTAPVTNGKITGWNGANEADIDDSGFDLLTRYYVNSSNYLRIDPDNFIWDNNVADTKLTATKLLNAGVKVVVSGADKGKVSATIADNAAGYACVVIVPKTVATITDLYINLDAGSLMGSTTLQPMKVNNFNVFNGAASDTKITKQTASLDAYYAKVNSGTNVINPLDITAYADDAIRIPLLSSMFDTTGVVANSPVTQQMVRDGKIEVRTAISSGSKAIKSVSMDYTNFSDLNSAIGSVKTANIKVLMVDPFVSIDEVDFALDVYLVIDGDRTTYKDMGMRLEGTLTYHTSQVYADDHYVDTSKGYVAESMDYNKNVEVDLGLGVSIHTKMFKGKKYYGIAKGDKDEADDVVFAKYPDVDRVFTLYTVGLNSTGDIVKLNLTGDVFHVYNADMKFIGMSNEMLPYSTKYYVANKKLAVEDAEIDEEPADEDPTDTDNAVTGGAEAPSNANNNPSTGC